MTPQERQLFLAAVEVTKEVKIILGMKNLWEMGITFPELEKLTAAFDRISIEQCIEQAKEQPCSCPKGGIYSDGSVCQECDGVEWKGYRTEEKELELKGDGICSPGQL
jgi:hypothetical protein